MSCTVKWKFNQFNASLNYLSHSKNWSRCLVKCTSNLIKSCNSPSELHSFYWNFIEEVIIDTELFGWDMRLWNHYFHDEYWWVFHRQLWVIPLSHAHIYMMIHYDTCFHIPYMSLKKLTCLWVMTLIKWQELYPRDEALAQWGWPN